MKEDREIKKRNRKPTAKMIKLGKLLAEGKHSIVECYRLTYNTSNMSDSVARNEASIMANHPSVTMIIEEEKRRISNISLQREKKKEIQITNDRERVLERLRLWMDNPPNDALQLRATEALMKAVGLNGSSVEITENKNSKDIAESISQILLSIEENRESIERNEEGGPLH